MDLYVNDYAKCLEKARKGYLQMIALLSCHLHDWFLSSGKRKHPKCLTLTDFIFQHGCL